MVAERAALAPRSAMAIRFLGSVKSPLENYIVPPGARVTDMNVFK